MLAAAVAALLAQATLFPDCLSDDAFISFRYARNLAEGHGLVFNPGDPAPVEGYTNFLWTLILAGTSALGLGPELSARALGLVAAAAAMAATVILVRRLAPAAPWAAGLAALLLAANGFFVVESVQGLETMLMAALVTAGVARLAAERQGAGAWPLSGLLLGLAALTRPEGYLVFASALAGAWLGDRAPLRRALAPATTFLAVTVPHLAFRLLYYGDWVPHTFHAKTGGGLEQAIRGLGYVSFGWLRVLPWVLLALLALGAGLSRRRRQGPGPARILTGATWLAATAGVVAEGGDFKPSLRFLVWSLPLMAALAAAGLADAAALLRRMGRRPATALAASLVVLALAWPPLASGPAYAFARQRRQDLRVLRQAARWLDRNLPPDAVIATGPAGAIPYYTGRETVDMWGLNDAVIGRRAMPDMGRGPAGHEKGDGAAVLARRPDVILFTAARLTPSPLPEELAATGYLYVSERELLALPGFRRSYRWRSVPLDGVTLNFYERIPEEDPLP